MTNDPSPGNDLEAAVSRYRTILAQRPDDGDACSNLGVALRALDRNAEALAVYAEGEMRCPDHANLAYNYGNALRDAGDLPAAVQRYRQALKINPEHVGAALNLNLTLTAQAAYDEAAAVCRAALTQHPLHPALHGNLGVTLWRAGQVEAAIACYRRSLGLQPDAARTHYNLGLALESVGDHFGAVETMRTAHDLAPDDADISTGLGQSILSCGDIEPALALFEAVAERHPDHLDARLGLARARLLAGNLERAWPDYAWHRRRGLNPPPDLKSPEWDGGNLQGQTVLIQAEQGMGDTIQFARYATLLSARGATVVLRCQKPLMGILSTIYGVAAVADQALPPPLHDRHVLLMDLPARFGTTLETIPGQYPYLTTPSRTRRSGAGPLLRVGITWAGSPSHQRDRQRSCSVEDFAPVFSVSGLEIVSLQTGPARAQLESSPYRRFVHDVAGGIRTFEDTASLIAETDLTITIDTSLAHLAGALARPVWTILAYAPDWRWLLERADTPWYPGMRLYRQSAPRDWRSVFERIAADLAEKSRKHAADWHRSSGAASAPE